MRRALLATIAAALALGPAAAAHVQVTPAEVAPGDPTLFTVIVPNERDDPTVSVELKIPDGVVPFSFEEVPGWSRSETRRDDGSLDTVRWEGSLPAGSLVRLPFLAAPPEVEGPITWPAVQTYEDGTVVRWIGDAGSEEPAAVTLVSADATRQNAGGEGGESGAAPVADGGGGRDGLTLGLAVGGLALGAAALVLAIAGRGRRA